MAVAGVFLTKTLIQSRLRLTGTSSADGLAIIDDAIKMARGRLYDGLGISRVSVIKTYGQVDNPATLNELTRAKADMTEVKMVKVQLLRSMPSLFMDGAAQVRTVWNDEGISRRAGETDIAQEMRRLENEIVDAMKDLAGDADAAGTYHIETVESDTVAPLPGDTMALRI